LGVVLADDVAVELRDNLTRRHYGRSSHVIILSRAAWKTKPVRSRAWKGFYGSTCHSHARPDSSTRRIGSVHTRSAARAIPDPGFFARQPDENDRKALSTAVKLT
ncbi:MAG: hypothetical protein ACREQD_11335, partial [Candidatus Binataceae bacterium]